MLNFNTLDKNSYNDLRLQILSKVEENKGLSTKVYLDSKGIQTIGIGMNLRSKKPREAVFTTILGNIKSLSPQAQTYEQVYINRLIDIFKKSYPQTTAGEAELQSELNAIMAERAADSRITFANKRTAFEFSDEQEIKNTFNTLVENVYEKSINTWYGSIIPDSYERLSLISLTYNSPSLLGSNLKTAIQDGNRSEAWYQIRYNSNSATTKNKKTGEVKPVAESTRRGLAKRRYYESQIFSLYNDRNTNGAIDKAEVLAINKMHTNHAKEIHNYDAKFEPFVANANRDYGSTALSGGKVQNLRESLARSRAFSVSQYLSGEDASKINQISFAQNSDNKVAFAAASASDPLVVPLKVKSSTLSQASNSNLRTESFRNSEETLSYGDDDNVALQSFDDDTSYYADDDVVYEDQQKVNSLLVGNSPSDVFYIDSKISGSDYITSSAGDGKIVINGIEIRGNASSLFNQKTGEVIPDEWSLKDFGFNLKKVAGENSQSDLAIYKSGTSFSENSAKIVIKDYPFSELKPAFGINLDLKQIGFQPALSLATERNVLKVGNSVYGLNDFDGKFFCSAVVQDDITHSNNYGFRIYDSSGNLVANHLLTNIVEYESTPSKITSRQISPISSGIKSCKLDDGSVAFIYGTREYSITPQNSFIRGDSYAFLAKISKEGVLLSNKLVHHIETTNGGIDAFYRSGYHIPHLVTPNDMCFNTPSLGYFCGSIDSEELKPTSLEQANKIFYEQKSQDNSFAILPSGHKIGSYYQGGNDYLGIVINNPVYALKPNNEKTRNYEIAGDYKTDSSLKKSILSLSQEEPTNLTILPNPKSITVIIGSNDNSLAQMSFPVDHHSQIEIYSSIDSEYKLDQLLNDEFDFASNFPADKKLKISRPVLRKLFSTQQEDKILADERSDPELVAAINKRRELRLLEERVGVKEAEEIVKASQRNLDALGLGNGLGNSSNFTNGNFTNATDDDYYYGYGDVDDDVINDGEIELENVATPHTVIRLNLADNSTQIVILQGVNATEVAQFPERYFLTQMEITNSPSFTPSTFPSQFPSKEPSEQPSNLPSGQPSGIPSYNPSKIPSGQPSNQPSGEPSSQPSGIPSSTPSHHPTAGDLIMPSGIPSELPSSQPTDLPSSQPSNSPSENPSNIPTAKPSLKQYAPSEIPSFNPSNNPSLPPSQEPTKETLNPSNQPSSNSPTSQPSNLPSKSKWPSNQPSLVSKDDSYLPTTKPSIESLLAKPSLIPTNVLTQKEDQPSPIPTSGENDNLSPSESPTNQIDFTSFSPSAGEIHSNSPTSLRSSQQPSNSQPNSFQPSFNLPSNDHQKNETPSATVINKVAIGVGGGVVAAALVAIARKMFSNKSSQVGVTNQNDNSDFDQFGGIGR